MSPTRLPSRNLDFLRACAVLCVLGDHTLTRTFAPNSVVLPQIGRAGVSLFFVHTSLVLMGSLERSGDRALIFYLRRACRIYPLAIATVLAVVLLGLTGAEPVTTVRLAANLTLTQNLLGAHDLLGPLWSLPLEVQMYIALPFCYFVARNSVRGTIGLLMAAVATGLAVLAEPHLWRLSVGLYGPCFVSGVLAYSLLKRGVRTRLPSWCWPVIVAAIVSAAVLLNATAGQPARSWFLCVLLAVLIPLVDDSPESRLSRWTTTIAVYSYGIYLLHAPALDIAFGWGATLPATLRWAFYVYLVTTLPWVAYHVIERPGVQLGRYLAARRSPARPVAVPVDWHWPTPAELRERAGNRSTQPVVSDASEA